MFPTFVTLVSILIVLASLTELILKSCMSNFQPLLTTCYRPITIIQGDGSVLQVPCGKCPACIHKSQVQWSDRIENEFMSAAAVLFVTLTYDNAHLPRVWLSYDLEGSEGENFRPKLEAYSNRPSITRQLIDEPISLTYKELCGLPHFKNSKYEYDYNKENCFGVVCKTDVQNFIKRLRRSFDYHVGDSFVTSFRYFFVSEYGPQTFRPHYHGLLFFSSRLAAETAFRVFISKCWKYSDVSQVKVGFADKGSSQYVAKYVNKYMFVPSILCLPPFRCFHLQSKKPCFGSMPVRKGIELSALFSNRGLCDKSYFSQKEASFIVKDVPYCRQFGERFFLRFVSEKLLSPRTIEAIFQLLDLVRHGVLQPKQCELYALHEFHVTPPNQNIKYAEVVRNLLRSKFFCPAPTYVGLQKLVFGIPSNKRAFIRLLSMCMDFNLSAEEVFYFRCKYFYNRFSLNLQRQHDCIDYLLKYYSPLEVFIYVFPTFDKDYKLPGSYEELDTFHLMNLTSLLEVFQVSVYDLYKSGHLIDWVAPESISRTYKDYVRECALKHYNNSLINHKFYNDL